MNEFTSLFETFEEQLLAGTKEEMEHTDDPKEAEQIARDHLKEDPHYYSKLKKCGLMQQDTPAKFVAHKPASKVAASERERVDAYFTDLKKLGPVKSAADAKRYRSIWVKHHPEAADTMKALGMDWEEFNESAPLNLEQGEEMILSDVEGPDVEEFNGDIGVSNKLKVFKKLAVGDVERKGAMWGDIAIQIASMRQKADGALIIKSRRGNVFTFRRPANSRGAGQW